MDKLVSIIEKVLMPIAEKVSDQKHLSAMKDGLLLVMPLTIVGSLFLVLASLPIPGYSEFIASIFGELWSEKLGYVVGVTMDLMGVITVIGTSYRLAKIYKVEALSASIIALVSFFLVTPYKINFLQEGAVDPIIVKGIPLALMGSRGLFVAIIVALVSTEIYRKVVQKGIVIKMPKGVPVAVSQSFADLIPATICLTFFWLVRVLLELTSFGDIHNLVTTVISTPLQGLGNSLFGAIIYALLVGLFWCFGIHGGAIMNGILGPVLMTLNDANRLAFESGQPVANTVTNTFFDIFIFAGGAGATLVFTLLMLYRARSKQLKSLGKLSIGSGLFNINEPVMFGTPIVLNPILMIPFVLAPVVMVIISYFAMQTGLVERAVGITVPWTTPIFISGYLATGGKISGVILQLVNFIVSMLIYYPFFRIWDNQKVKEESEIAIESDNTINQ
ncbi:PTS cellobiose transporter subunit IIC [Clostridium septicum]|uniref:Permease IIC component n=1 Tax=Clostridium septicum TaxID=1504 RepID=A0A9N7PJT3_CLOSE|nr:PTS cellobiose transporter subunit IIC [Clostridium septicum]AYE35126.1 PTS system, cellobiose-specific IIC component [Clostridium septicum]MDU1314224.1 PTS cellobiose transporter subunit IIC [Clostridium septicum]QAS60518.1 PTS cellobiose transporter subunit IIC [Clostridium septicum]UEC20223.1 PTS cellobiose transporter subunit IIC [Clostridium septicum]USS01723.1 PTS cellobiose transporter subunit IIC [Clostridium septicum]